MATIINSGTMDRLLTFLVPTPGRGTAGGVKNDWASAAEQSWAEWLSPRSAEVLSAGARFTDLTGVLRIRHRPDVRANWRVVMDDELYELLGPPSQDMRRDAMDLPVRRLDSVVFTPETVPAYVPPLSSSFVNVLALAGEAGGTGYLDGVPTAYQSVGCVVQYFVSGQPQQWVLEASTDATVSGEKQRPLDFHLTTNAKVWRRIM